ncbi:MAG: Sir2 family NAD-dependent protein deacetylase [Candidatus Heimdallarchaeota archaeon]|nr:Sir2 family NAD-dependent protein deacetylase [Candidatus Heimdallarchaeota archaeon]
MDNLKHKSLDEKISLIAQWIHGSKHFVAFTGAGISTASGIPDFRGPNGVWTRRDKGLPPPKMDKTWSEIKPNRGHYVLVELQEMNLLKCLITQNTDGLHLISGIKPSLLSELHGNGQFMECLNCDFRATYEESHWDKQLWGPGYRTSSIKANQPSCPKCNGRLISTVVNFGDPLPERDFNLAKIHTENSDIFLVIGSSLVVFPAADLPKCALKNGAKVIIINKGVTPLDNVVTLKIEEDIEEVFVKILTKIKEYS